MTPSRRRHRFWRVLAATAGAVVLVVLLLAFGLFPQGWLRRLAERQILAALGPGSRVGRLHVFPGRLRADAGDIVIVGPGFRLEAPSARVELGLSTLLGRTFTVRALELRDPVLTIVPLPAAAAHAEPASSQASRPVLIGDVDVTGGSLRYRDPNLGGEIHVEDVSLTGGVGKGALRLQTGALRWERPHPVVIEPIRASVSISSTLEAHLDSLEIATRRSRLTASGALGNMMRLEPNIDIQSDLDLADAETAAPGTKMAGHVTGSVHVTGLANTLHADANLEGRELTIADRPIERAHIHAAYAPDGTRGDFDADAAGGRVDGTVTLAGEQLTAECRGAHLDLHRVAVLAQQPAQALGGQLSLQASAHGRLAERIDTALTLDAKGTSGDVAFTAHAEASGPSVGAEHRLDLAWRASGTAAQTARTAGQPALVRASLNADGSAQGAWPATITGHVTGNGQLAANSENRPFAIDAQVQARGAEISATASLTGELGRLQLAAISGQAGRRIDVDGHGLALGSVVPGAQGAIDVSFHGAGAGDVLEGSGEVLIADLAWRDVPVGTLTASIASHGQRTAIDAEIPDLKVSGHATIEPQHDRSRRAGLGVTAQLSLQDTPLDALSALLPDQRAVHGHLRGELNATAPLASLATAEVKGRFDSIDLAADPLRGATVHPFTLEASASRLAVRDFMFRGPGIDIETSGAIDLGRHGALDATIDARVDLAKLPLPRGVSAGGLTQAAIVVSGTREHPQMHGHVDLNALRVAEASFPAFEVASARVLVGEDAIQLPEAEATFATGHVRLSGELPIDSLWNATRPARNARLDVHWEGVDAAALQTASDEPLSGELSGDMRVEGSWRDASAARMSLHMPALELAAGDTALSVSPIDAEVRDQKLSIAPFEIASAEGALHAHATADLRTRTLDAAATGAADLRVLAPLLTSGSLAGHADVDLSVSGPFTAPRPAGHLVLRGAVLRLREITTPLTDIDGTVAFDGPQIRIASVQANWGGGPVALSGGARLEHGGLVDVQLQAKGTELALRYEDIRTRVNADVTLTGRTGDLLLGGSIDIERGLFDKDIFLGESMGASAVAASDSPFLRTLGLNLKIKTVEPFLVRNNLAQVQARGNLTLRGDAQNPAPFGSFQITENGRVFIQEREFRIDSGTITYVGSLDPDLDIQATTRKPVSWQEGTGNSPRKREATVTVHVTGDLAKPALELTSDADDLSSTEIASLLATGRPDPGRERGAWLVGEQAAELLAGPLSRKLSRKLESLGFDEVTVEPNLIAREQNPGAHFTFGKNLTSWSSLIYSLGLDDPEERFIQLNLHPVTNFTVELQRADDNTYTSRVSHVLRFGRPERHRAGSRSDERVTVTGVTIETPSPELAPKIRSWLSLETGDRITYWDLQNRADNIRKRLVDEGHIEADVVARLKEGRATLRVLPGPVYRWRVDGLPDPPGLDSMMRKALYAEEALENGEKRLLAAARDRGYLRADVDSHVEGEGETRTLLFTVALGKRYAGADVVFEGASALSQRALLRAAGGAGELATEPARARRNVETRYREANYPAAVVRAPQVNESQGRLEIRVPVDEGPQAVVSEISCDGQSLSPSDLAGLARNLLGRTPDDTAMSQAVQDIRNHYFHLGYPAVRVTTRLIAHAPDLELHFAIDPGDPIVVEQIDFAGSSTVDPEVLRRELPVHVGDPLDPRKLTLAESRLQKFGLARVSLMSDEEEPERLIVETRPRSRVTVNYALEYGDGPGTGASVDVQAPNLTRFGLSPGASYAYDTNKRQTRGWIKLPAFFHRGTFSLTGALETLKLSPDTLQTPVSGAPRENLLVQRTHSIELLQQVELAGQWQLQYGYQYDHVKTSGTPSPSAEVLCGPHGGLCDGNVSELKVSLLRDTRDHVLDARRGRFWSISGSYAPTALGSGATFVKAYGQVAAYRSLLRNFTWAQSYRVGAGHGFGGQALFLRERWSAGGAYSLRGYATDSVGPTNGLLAVAGDGVLVLNQELRYHHPSGLGAAIFYDGGNVYRKASEIGTSLRHSVGFGLRYSSPVGLLRFDLGFPIARRTGEAPHQFFFSLGQAF